MLLYDENFKELDVEAFKKEVLEGLYSIQAPSKEELEKELIAGTVQFTGEIQGQMLAMSLNFSIGDILKAIKRAVCAVLNAGSSESEIVDAILEAISALPGGVIFKWVAKRLVKYILGLGYQRFCSVD